MVVKGDGSLMDAAMALNCPVETILSGPAASLVGARHLCGEDTVIVPIWAARRPTSPCCGRPAGAE